MYQRRILLCVTGLSPQVVTETLYALAVEGDFTPTEIHLITTIEGAESARLSLLDPDEGHFYALCRDYSDHGLEVGHIRFDTDTIHIITTSKGHPLDDIRSEADNQAAADSIAAVVRELSAAPNNVIYASIAGGRKTMGFYLGYAMSLFGRSQDRLSHVLVSPPFESLGEFYYPPRKPRRLELPRERNRYVHTSDATITLADIPFVRLRGHLDAALLSEGVSYSETVRRTQRSVDPAELVLDPAPRRVRCGNTIIPLKPIDFAFYAWFAKRLLEGQPGIHWSREDGQELLALYGEVINPYSGEYGRAEAALKKGMTKEYYEPRLSRVRSLLNQMLGKGPAAPYQITSLDLLPGTRYRLQGLTLRPEQVRFEPIIDSKSNTLDSDTKS